MRFEVQKERALADGGKSGAKLHSPAGLAGWLLARIGVRREARPRLALVERIALAPRQSLALVEAEGRRFLVATSPEGAPAFYPLDLPGPGAGRPRPLPAPRTPAPRTTSAPAARVSW